MTEYISCPYCGENTAANKAECEICGEQIESKSNKIVCPYCGEEIINSDICNICGESLKQDINKKTQQSKHEKTIDDFNNRKNKNFFVLPIFFLLILGIYFAYKFLDINTFLPKSIKETSIQKTEKISLPKNTINSSKAETKAIPKPQSVQKVEVKEKNATEKSTQEKTQIQAKQTNPVKAQTQSPKINEKPLDTYYYEVRNHIGKYWNPQLVNGSGQAVIRFKISETGQFTEISVVSTTGNYSLETVALNTIRYAKGYEAPPSSYKGGYITLPFEISF